MSVQARWHPQRQKNPHEKKVKLNKKLQSPLGPSHQTRVIEELGLIDNKIILSHKSEIERTEKRAIDKIKNDSRYFYNYAKSKSKIKCPVGPLMHNDRLVNEPAAMCEILKNQFETVFSTPIESYNMSSITQQPGPRCLEEVIFTEEDIASAIKSIPVQSAPGPDGIPAKFLRECVDQLKKPIHTLWKVSSSCGIVPRKTVF